MSGGLSVDVPHTIAIVLNYEREEMTAMCVAALERSTTPVELLIVDNASPDGSGARLQARFPQHGYLQTGGNLGYAGGNARGVAWALAKGANRVFIVNDDAEPAPDCLALLHAALDADSLAAAASPLMLHAAPEGTVWWAGGRFNATRVMGTHEGAGVPLTSLAEAEGAPRAVEVLCGCAMLVTAEALQTIGGFREEFWAYAEDLELSLRYRKAGRRLLFVPRARLVHHVAFPEPPAAGWKIARRDQNRRRIAALHLGAIERLRFWSFFVPSRVLLLVRYVATGDFDRASGIVRGAFGRI